jgi:hypothetical protein
LERDLIGVGIAHAVQVTVDETFLRRLKVAGLDRRRKFELAISHLHEAGRLLPENYSGAIGAFVKALQQDLTDSHAIDPDSIGTQGQATLSPRSQAVMASIREIYRRIPPNYQGRDSAVIEILRALSIPVTKKDLRTARRGKR